MKNSQHEIRTELKRHEAMLLKSYWREVDTYMLVNLSISGNTIRAFRKGKSYNWRKPSELYRHWLYHHYLTKSEIKEQIINEPDFSKIHHQAIKMLSDFWESEESISLEFYLKAKVIDLTFKSIPIWNEIPSEERRTWLFRQANVPIDKYSLLALRMYDCENFVKVPPNPSMNFITSEEHYKLVQKRVKEIIGEDFAPLLFDLYSWNYRGIVQYGNENLFPLPPIQ